MALQNIPLSSINRDADTQARASVDDAAINDYVNALGRGETLPPMIVFGPPSGGEFFIGDGWHRATAYDRRGQAIVTCDVREGTERDARIYACGANDDHGVRRTNADKRRAVEILLEDGDWGQKSSRMIADAAKVTHPFVEKIRQERIDDGALETLPKEREGTDGRKINPRKKAKEKPDLEERDTSEEDEAFFEECDEAAAEEKAKKKNGQEADPAKLRRAVKDAFGAYQRALDAVKKGGNCPKELMEMLEYWNSEIASGAKEWWG